MCANYLCGKPLQGQCISLKVSVLGNEEKHPFSKLSLC